MSSACSIHPLPLAFLLPRRSRLLLHQIVSSNHHEAISEATVEGQRGFSSTRASLSAKSKQYNYSGLRRIKNFDKNKGGNRGRHGDGSTAPNLGTISFEQHLAAEAGKKTTIYRPFKLKFKSLAPSSQIRADRSQAMNKALAFDKRKEVPPLPYLLNLRGLSAEHFGSFYQLYSKMYYPAKEHPGNGPTFRLKYHNGELEEDSPSPQDRNFIQYSVRNPPFFASESKIKRSFIRQVDPLLPPSLRMKAQLTAPAIELDDSLHRRILLSSLDVPWPSIVQARDDEQVEHTDPDLQAADESFESELTKYHLIHLLKIIERARTYGVDILCELLWARREKALLWVVGRLVDPEPNASPHTLFDMWRGSSASESWFADPRTPRQNPAIDVMAAGSTKPQTEEVLRRRLGVGAVLRSASSILHAGWARELENSAILATKQGDAAEDSPLEHENDIEAAELFSLSNPLPTTSPLVKPHTPEEFFSYAVLLLAYLHAHDHVPASVYSQEHPVLHEMNHRIIRRMMEAAESSYLFDMGYRSQSAEDNSSIDWACWIELTITIANERGLSATAGDIISSLGRSALYEPDEDCIDRRKSKSSQSHYFSTLLNDSGSKTLDENDEGPGKMRISRSVALHAFESLMATGAYDGVFPSNQTERIIKHMCEISWRISSGISQNLANRILECQFIELRSANAVSLLKLQINGGWKLQVYYELLLGAIDRVDRSQVIEIWRRLETDLIRSGKSAPHPLLGRRHSKAIAPLTSVAENHVFRHPLHILSSLLHFMRMHMMAQPHYMRHIILTAVTPSQLPYPPIMNPLLSYAAEMNEPDFVGYIFSEVPDPRHGPTLSTVLSFLLKINRPQMAKMILQKKRDVKAPMHDGFDFGLLVQNAFKRSFEEGMGLMYRAIRDTFERTGQETPQSIQRRFPFAEGVDVEKLPKTRATIAIGDTAWLSMLNAAVDRQDYNLTILALAGLGLDLTDPDVAAKMGTHVFTILLKGIVERGSSWSGVRIWKLYCTKPRPGAANETMLGGVEQDRNVPTGILEYRELERKVATPIYTPGRYGHDEEVAATTTNAKFVSTGSRPERDKGLVVPNAVTLITIVHKAIRERDMVNRSRSILDKNLMDRSKEEDELLLKVWKLSKAEGGIHGWATTLRWAKKMWQNMGLSEGSWSMLDKPKDVVMVSVKLDGATDGAGGKEGLSEARDSGAPPSRHLPRPRRPLAIKTPQEIKAAQDGEVLLKKLEVEREKRKQAKPL